MNKRYREGMNFEQMEIRKVKVKAEKNYGVIVLSIYDNYEIHELVILEKDEVMDLAINLLQMLKN